MCIQHNNTRCKRRSRTHVRRERERRKVENRPIDFMCCSFSPLLFVLFYFSLPKTKETKKRTDSIHGTRKKKKKSEYECIV